MIYDQNTPLSLAEKDRQARECCADPHRFFKAFSRTARRFQHMNRSPRYRVMTLVGGPNDFLKFHPIKLAIGERLAHVSSWEDVFATLVRELVMRKPAFIQTLSQAGYLPWIENLNPSVDLITAFQNGETNLKFMTLVEAFCAVQWLIVMCDIKLNDVIVQIDPYESEEAWRKRESEIRTKRQEESRVLREIDEARLKWAEQHPEDDYAQDVAKQILSGEKPANKKPKEDLTWEI